jgi:hypothetical protein
VLLLIGHLEALGGMHFHDASITTVSCLVVSLMSGRGLQILSVVSIKTATSSFEPQVCLVLGEAGCSKAWPHLWPAIMTAVDVVYM